MEPVHTPNDSGTTASGHPVNLSIQVRLKSLIHEGKIVDLVSVVVVADPFRKAIG